MQQKTPSRRAFLAGVAGALGALPFARLGAAQAADAPHLSSDDSAAKALNYVDDVATLTPAKDPILKPGSHCGNCAQFQGGSSEWGGCTIFPGKSVHSKGWCRAWAPKA